MSAIRSPTASYSLVILRAQLRLGTVRVESAIDAPGSHQLIQNAALEPTRSATSRVLNLAHSRSPSQPRSLHDLQVIRVGPRCYWPPSP
jgi:hypothetical protein